MRQQTDPQKPPYFYLSYAHAEDKSKVEQFFNDLSVSVRDRAGLPLDETVGCCEKGGDREMGLRTSRVMIALLSLPYFKDKTAGREWQIFVMRKALSDSNDTQVIIPVRWLSYSGATPVVINQTPIFNGNGDEPVATMLRSREKRRDYADFVNNLANYIVDSTASFELREIDSIPDDISNAFENVVDPPIDSETPNLMAKQPRNQNIVNNLLIIDRGFAKSIADQINERTANSSGDAVDEVVRSAQASAEPYSVYVVDDNKDLLETIKATCDYSPSPLFNCETYEDPLTLLNKVEGSGIQASPDLFVIDLELAGKSMQGLEVIERLALSLDVPSAIMAISDNLSGSTLLNVAGLSGAVAGLAKPFNEDELLEKMTRLAEIGRNRRLRRIDPTSTDKSRSERPVFVSYSSENNRPARFITNSFEIENIDVFYAGYSIRGGDSPPKEVREGLKKTRVFVPLISADFVKSSFCRAELANALKLKADTSRNPPLKIIPILYDYASNVAKEDDLIAKCLEKNRELNMSKDNPVDTFQILLMRVQQFLRAQSRTATAT